MSSIRQDALNVAKEWNESRYEVKNKLSKIADNLDEWFAASSCVKIASSATGITGATCILAAPFTGGASLLLGSIIAGVSAAGVATGGIMDFASTKILCSKANDLLKKHQRLTESLTKKIKNYIYVLKDSKAVVDFVREVASATGFQFISAAAPDAAPLLEQFIRGVIRHIEFVLLKVVTAVGLLLTVISFIETCSKIEDGSKHAKEIRKILNDL